MRRNIKKEFEAMGQRIKEAHAEDDSGKKLKPKIRQKAVKIAAESLLPAFEATGLEITEENWKLLAIILARAVYGPGSGRPKMWDRTALKKLRRSIQKLSRQYPIDTELQLCKILVDRGKYKQSAQTLRRRLHLAKPKGKKTDRRAKKSRAVRRKDEGWD